MLGRTLSGKTWRAELWGMDATQGAALTPAKFVRDV